MRIYNIYLYLLNTCNCIHALICININLKGVLIVVFTLCVSQ